MEAARIRSAVLTDGEAIAFLSEQLGYPTTPEGVKERLEMIALSPDHGAFVAEAPNGSIIGWIHVFRKLLLETDAFAELGGLVVADSHREVGVGRLLLAGAEEWARANGLKVLRVRSRSGRAGAHRFYEALGFQRLKTQYVFVKEIEC